MPEPESDLRVLMVVPNVLPDGSVGVEFWVEHPDGRREIMVEVVEMVTWIHQEALRHWTKEEALWRKDHR